MKSVFDQFKIALNKEITYDTYLDFSLSNITTGIMVMVLGLIILFQFLLRFNKLIPNNYSILVEGIYMFIFNLVAEQAGKKGYKYFPHFLTIFLLILTFNLVGLLPFGFTVTSQIIVTLTIALSYFFAWILIGIVNLKKDFIYLFYPKQMPLWLQPLLSVIETLSFALRPFSLGIRLFANMLAGHILLHIIASALVYMVISITILLLAPFVLILFGVGILEFGIALLQAYIFTILLAIYLKDSLVSHKPNTNNI